MPSRLRIINALSHCCHGGVLLLQRTTAIPRLRIAMPSHTVVMADHASTSTRIQKKLRSMVKFSTDYLGKTEVENRQCPLTLLSWRTTPAPELHPLERGNWYMSRYYGMMHTNVRAVTLTEFGFTLIQARISCAAPPTETAIAPPSLSLTCKLLTIPSPKTMTLNGTNSLRAHGRLAAEFINY